MTPSLEYLNGVRLVKTEIARLEKMRILRAFEPEASYNIRSFIHYVTESTWNVNLRMQYGNDLVEALSVWEIFYTFPCAGLTFIADQGSRIESARPELIESFILTENRA